jgi:RNA polymerase sigma-70 factor, ECF subfamily
MNSVDERALIMRAQKNPKAFAEIFDAYYDRIYAYAYRRVGSRDEAEDIAASVFEDALGGIKRWRWQGKPILAWLYRIAFRRVADYYRSRHIDKPLDDVIGMVTNHIESEIVRNDEYTAVRCGMERLNAREREVIQLAYFEELDGAEMAVILDCSSSSAYVRLHRALKKLHAVLASDARGDL